jgi:hypothetical protein
MLYPEKLELSPNCSLSADLRDFYYPSTFKTATCNGSKRNSQQLLVIPQKLELSPNCSLSAALRDLYYPSTLKTVTWKGLKRNS